MKNWMIAPSNPMERWFSEQIQGSFNYKEEMEHWLLSSKDKFQPQLRNEFWILKTPFILMTKLPFLLPRDTNSFFKF